MATELAKAYVQIVPSARGIQGSITRALGGEASAAGISAGQDFGSRMMGTLRNVIAAAGIGKALAATISEGAALQQSLGGVETLFKENAAQVAASAQEAYRTAGLSANAYMETVTGFSARLLQGLGGDTAAAARLADTAIADMADNANKFGTDMQTVQDTYQSLARGNYEMLDNLKLGYGGTQAEMARLINDSGVLGDAMTATAENVNSIGFDKLIEAIHAVQEEMGVTGTTAQEAATTLTGSFNAMKAAAQNVLGGLTLGQDIGPALNALAQTVTTFLAGNLIPAVWNILKALPGAAVTFIQTAVPQLAAAFLQLLPQLQAGLTAGGPQLLQAGIEMLGKVGQGMVQGIPQMLNQALPMLLQFTENLRANFGQLIDAGIDMLLNFAKGLVAGLPALIEYVPLIISNIAGLINDNAPKILQAGLQLIIMLGKGLIQAVPVIIANMGNILQAIVDVISAINWISLGSKIIQGIGNGIRALAGFLKDAATTVFNGAIQYIKGLPAQALQLGKDFIQGLINGIGAMAGALWDAAVNIAKSALNAIKSFFGIASPSKVMRDEVGRWIPAGVAEGIEKNTRPITSAMNRLAGLTAMPLRGGLTDMLAESNVLSGAPGMALQPAGGAPVLQQTIYTHDSLSPAELTREAENFLARARWKNP